MWLRSLIADMRKAVADDPATAQAVFAALGTLVSVPREDVRRKAHSGKVDESPALGGPLGCEYPMGHPGLAGVVPGHRLRVQD